MIFWRASAREPYSVLATEAIADALEHGVRLRRAHRLDPHMTQGSKKGGLALLDVSQLLGPQLGDEHDLAGLDVGEKQSGDPSAYFSLPEASSNSTRFSAKSMPPASRTLGPSRRRALATDRETACRPSNDRR